MAELLVVLAVIAIMSAISIPYILNYRKAYRTDDQSLKILDMMREAGQLALTRRRTVRFEIDLTDNTYKVIEENGTPHRLVKSIPMELPANVRVDTSPSGVTRPTPPNYPDAIFGTDSVGHLNGSTSVTGHRVWSVRFQRDGSVVNTGGTPISATLFLWPPSAPGSSIPRSMREVRAITIFGGSGAVRFWKHNGSTFVGT